MLVALMSWGAGAHAAGVKVRVTGDVVNVRTKAPITNGTVLEKGDRVQGRSENANLQLECPDGATQTLTDRFDALILAADGGLCSIRLDKGTAAATTAPKSADGKLLQTADGKQPQSADGKPQPSQTEIHVGLVTLGAASTHFGATVVDAEGKTPAFEAYVIEGQIIVREPERKTSLVSGQMLNGLDHEVQSIPEARFAKLARVYAQLDLTQPTAEAPPRAALEKAYLEAFRNPSNMKARGNLHTLQLKAAPNAPVTRYLSTAASKAQKVQESDQTQSKNVKKSETYRPAAPTGVAVDQPY
jgi:hypothetical protein